MLQDLRIEERNNYKCAISDFFWYKPSPHYIPVKLNIDFVAQRFFILSNEEKTVHLAVDFKLSIFIHYTTLYLLFFTLGLCYII